MTAWTDALVRAEGLPRRYVDWDHWWQGEDPARHLLYLGGGGRQTWDACHRRQVCDSPSMPVLAVVGPYLRAIQRAQGELRTLAHPHLLGRHPPLYYGGEAWGELIYVDIDRAYWQIYTRATLDVHYDGENGPRNGQCRFLDPEEIAVDKLVRNGLLGMLRRTWRHGLDHGIPFRERLPEEKQRPNLWGLVMDVLELAAWDMRNLGALYIHTDGYIFGHKDGAADAIDLLRDRYGLMASVRAHGLGYVRGVGRWRIGDEVHGPTAEGGRPSDSMQPIPRRLASELTAWMQAATMMAVDQ